MKKREFNYRYGEHAQPGDLMTIGVNREDFALQDWFLRGDMVKVLRIDGHGILCEHGTHTGLLAYFKPAELFPLGTVFDDGKPLTPLEAYAQKSAMLQTRAAVIVVVGLLTILILFSCFPQGL